VVAAQAEQKRQGFELIRILGIPGNEALVQRIVAEGHELGNHLMQDAPSIRLSEAEPGPRGADRIEFCFAPNPGEDLLPLRRIASSGEIARVMLAVKTVLSVADSVPILIFDEVDANVGGRIAVKVAEELAAIGARHQVFCITHLPQIAAAGASHFEVAKRVTGGRTATTMSRLTAKARERELTRMLGASEDSEAAVRHAREMLGHS